MQVFVLRHGQAEAQITTDEARNLTDRGRADVAESIHRSLTELTQVQEIWASSLVRAQQTALIAQEILSAHGTKLKLRTTDLIVPEGNPAELFDALQATDHQSLLLVSHQPFVGNFLDIFCGSARGSHSMDTSSLALVECATATPICGELRWLRHVYG